MEVISSYCTETVFAVSAGVRVSGLYSLSVQITFVR